MELDLNFYRSSLDGPALGICIFAGIQLYRTYRHYSAMLVITGFVIVTVAYLANSYCLGVAQISDYIQDYPYLCHPSTSYVRGVGYFLVAFGLIKFIEYIKSA